MRKIFKIVFLIMLIAMFTVTFIACDKDNGDDNNPNGNEDNTPPQKLQVCEENDDDAKLLSGYVGNIDYEKVGDIQISFGEDSELAATSDDNGNFSFYYKDPHNYTADRIMDFISVDTDNYKYRAFVNTQHVEDSPVTVRCVLVIDDKDSDFNMNLIQDNIEIRLSFGQEETMKTMLPVGYPLEDGTFVQTKRLAVEHDDTVFGVKLYLNETYFDYSKRSGYHIPYLIPDTVLKLEHPGLFYKIKKNQAGGNEVSLTDGNKYTFAGSEDFIEFKAIGENNDPDVLKENQQWKEFLDD